LPGRDAKPQPVTLPDYLRDGLDLVFIGTIPDFIRLRGVITSRARQAGSGRHFRRHG
jgi:hypothetical protein